MTSQNNSCLITLTNDILYLRFDFFFRDRDLTSEQNVRSSMCHFFKFMVDSVAALVITSVSSLRFSLAQTERQQCTPSTFGSNFLGENIYLIYFRCSISSPRLKTGQTQTNAIRHGQEESKHQMDVWIIHVRLWRVITLSRCCRPCHIKQTQTQTQKNNSLPLILELWAI